MEFVIGKTPTLLSYLLRLRIYVMYSHGDKCWPSLWRAQCNNIEPAQNEGSTLISVTIIIIQWILLTAVLLFQLKVNILLFDLCFWLSNPIPIRNQKAKCKTIIKTLIKVISFSTSLKYLTFSSWLEISLLLINLHNGFYTWTSTQAWNADQALNKQE